MYTIIENVSEKIGSKYSEKSFKSVNFSKIVGQCSFIK